MAQSPEPRGDIVLAGLKKSYGPVPAVRSSDLTIAPGETVALLGPNGVGKSTTSITVLTTRPCALGFPGRGAP